jgi:hypothetical protein
LAPLYLLLALAALLLVAMIAALTSVRGRRLRGEPFLRRALLTADEQRCYQLLSEAVGAGYRLCPRVAALSLLQPMRGIGGRQQRLAHRLLAEGWADLLICTAAELSPVAVVRLLPEKSGRAQRRLANRLQAAFAAAGFPVIELRANDPPSIERLRTLVERSIAMAGAPVIAQLEPALVDQDEDTLLSELAAAMREPDEEQAR